MPGANGPLSDLVVLDLTRYLSGPFCTLQLAGMGARVIKVDHPVSGDPTINAPPFVNSDGPSLEPSDGAIGIAYLKRQRGKESVAIDLKQSIGAALFRDLAEHADVVVENFRPGVAARLGIGYEDLKQVNPRIVYCAISGYGQTGPDAGLKSYDLMAQAASGLMAITGQPDGPPTKAGSPMADTIAGTWGAMAILAALFERGRSGIGQAIDVSMQDCLFSMMMDEPLDCYPQLGQPSRIGNRIMRFSPFNTYQTADGWIVIGTVAPQDWHQLAELIGHAELAQHPDFRRVEWRIENNDQVDALISQWTIGLTTTQAIAALKNADIACSPVRTAQEAIDSSHLKARGMVQNLSMPDGSGAPVVGADMPFRMSRSQVGHTQPAPGPGGDTERVLREFLKLSAANLAELNVNRVISSSGGSGH